MHCGLAGSFVEVGDPVCLLQCRDPAIVLRPAEGGHYYVVGDVHVPHLTEYDQFVIELGELEPDPSKWETFRIH